MEGKILGFDTRENDGAIKGKDGQRYSFTLDQWKGNMNPSTDMLVDFETEEHKAIRIYPIRDQEAEEHRIIIGIISLAITLLLGFIGTLISRMVISKHSLSKAAFPTFIHLIVTLIGVMFAFHGVGLIFYLIGTAYFMAKNYRLIPGSPSVT